MMNNRYIIAFCILLLALVAQVSAASVTISPDQIENGGTITIAFSDLDDEANFALQMIPFMDCAGQNDFSFQIRNVTIPFRLNSASASLYASPVTSAGVQYIQGESITTITWLADEIGIVNRSQTIGDKGPGTIQFLKAFGTPVQGTRFVDLMFEVRGTKTGSNSGNLTFEVDDGFSDAVVEIIVLVDSEKFNQQVQIGSPPPPPIANFTTTPTTGTAPLTVQFTDTSTGNPASWAWEYSTGNGNVWTEFSTEQHPVHVFTETETYSLRLTAANAGGSGIETKSDSITVTPQPTPTPTPTPTPQPTPRLHLNPHLRLHPHQLPHR